MLFNGSLLWRRGYMLMKKRICSCLDNIYFYTRIIHEYIKVLNATKP